MADYTFPRSSSSGSYIEGRILLEQSIDKTTQTSSLTAKLYVRKGPTTLTDPTFGTWSYKLQIDGVDGSGETYKSVLTDWVLIQTRSFTKKHASDGRLSVRIIASITAPSETTLEGETTKSDSTINLTPIQLPTTIDSLTCTKEGQKYDYLDGTITAKYTPKVATFYNQRKIYVNVNGTLTEIHTKNLGQQSVGQHEQTMQFDANELAKIYDAVKTTTNATIQVRFITYSNSTYTARVGTVQYLEIGLKLPDTVVPTAELNVSPVNSNSWIIEQGIYVAGLSGATATLSHVTPSAGIKEEELTTTIIYDDVTYNTKTLNVSTLKKSGSIKFTAKVTDPRGRYVEVPKNITVLQYSAPVIASMQVDRGTYKDAEWIAADEGQDVRVVFKTTLSLKDNDNTYSAAFKIDGSSKTPNYGATTELESDTDCTVYFLGINGEASHTLAMTVTDKTGSTGTANITIPTIHITIEFNDSGKGIAFGKTSENNAFECAWNAEFGGNVSIDGNVSISGKELDIIVEQGTSAINHTVDGVTARSGTWTYRKWSSGIMECWGIGNVNVKINMTWSGTGLYYGVVSTINFPFAFTDIPVCTVDVAYGNHEKSLVVASCGRGTNVYARPIMLCRNTSETVNCDLHYHAIGRWK